ncbi:conserved hypothetical protein [Perkinsus marinus ATCC 50983]|uniref:PHD-type domain-containing protein n=1 Tax=Perkinsus marinus (strain ATCC 50983 / TXsc) TaxID=423536 RepID=C5K4M7_PERM5|nr:conserved hypothetical protein [Perkinsus marinus ATCC 50983]EER20299.1 conserved hypothetical protein [Perkinsus marinus ATCC 50983]|eukprot:XP_002788503.1 conserved hypothetical protein [Perkinsus marinus ATCC 50983]
MQQGAQAYDTVEEVLEELDDDGVVCDVCLIQDQDDEDGNPNLILICDACEAAVHQDCYAIARVPKGAWYCDFCTYARENSISEDEARRERQCLLCPRRTGALLRIKGGTFGGYWIHAACAWWIPECSIQEGRYGYISLDAASMRNLQERFEAVCDVCHLPHVGAVLQCSAKGCYRGFHVPCARAMNYALDLVAEADHIHDDEEGDVILPLKAYCDKHRHEAYPDEPRFKRWKSDQRQRVCYVQNLINRNRTILIDMKQNLKDRSRWALLINQMLLQEFDGNANEIERVLSWPTNKHKSRHHHHYHHDDDHHHQMEDAREDVEEEEGERTTSQE